MHEVRTKIGEGGRVIIPATIRQRLHLDIGADIILQIKDEELHITTPLQALKRIQEEVKQLTEKNGQSISLVDQLLAMRRAEAEHEE